MIDGPFSHISINGKAFQPKEVKRVITPVHGDCVWEMELEDNSRIYASGNVTVVKKEE